MRGCYVRALNKWKWTSIALLSVVIPIGLLVTFRLTGIIPEPPKPEIFSAEAAYWSMDRPKDICEIRQIVENVYMDNISYVSFKAFLFIYWENDPDWGSTEDTIRLSIYANASVAEGFIEYCRLYFYEQGNSSLLWASQDSRMSTLVNLAELKTTSFRQDYLKAYTRTVAVNYPDHVSYSHLGIVWIFLDKGDVDHQLEIVLEVTYRTRTTCKTINLPIEVDVYADVGNVFETARVVIPGVYNGSLHWLWDPEDYYSVFVETGQVIHVQMTPSTPNSDFDSGLYDPNRELKAHSYSTGNVSTHINFEADSTGLWYIRLRCIGDFRGPYSLNVTMSPLESMRS